MCITALQADRWPYSYPPYQQQASLAGRFVERLVAQLELRLDTAAHNLFRRDAVDFLGQWSQKLDGVTGNDDHLETVGRQIN